MRDIYDAIIVGGGPAGYTAALYLARAGLSTLLLEPMYVGGQMATTGKVENYPGLSAIDGYELGARMQADAHAFGAKTVYETVTALDLSSDIKKIATDAGREYFSRSVIIATGASPRRLSLEGEDRLIGAGVHFCAHCDGGFYRDKEVVVIGGGNTAVGDALYLSRIAKQVTLIHRRDTLRAVGREAEALAARENVRILYNTRPVEFITEDGALTGLKVRGDDGEHILASDGIFVAIGRVPSSELVRGVLPLDGQGYIIAGEDTVTNIAGVFAAGDVRTKPLRQIVTATADGAVSAEGAIRYLDGMHLL
ncbi:MAG: FAD-dependent oxidoreductase [Clostridia bacterium]|nr:FAD-dependent oxidoreductase [Clostridia bacterium]